MFRSALLLLLFVCGQDTVWSVRIVEIRVPAHAREGGTALLGCQYDLGNDDLYSVKWYKDSREFFRYLPRQYPSINTFHKPGVHVNVEKSSNTEVLLEHLTKESEGNYSCEVSGEAPKFATDKTTKHITIHILPESGPHVTGLKDQYGFGDEVITNCSSTSRPKANLKWLINDKPVPLNYLQGPWYRVSESRIDAIETILQLRFIVEAKHFDGSAMNLKCQATIAPLYQRETSSSHYIRLQSLAKEYLEDNTLGTDQALGSSSKRPAFQTILVFTVLTLAFFLIF